MADYQNVDTKERVHQAENAVRATTHLSATKVIGDTAANLDPQLFNKFHDAMLSHTAHEGRATVRQAVMSGVSAELIADHYIPALAHNYGDLWCSDELTFGEVTIAVSRLQTVLRDLEGFWPRVNELRTSSQANLMLIIPRDVFHTLGAFVLSGQLRRKGISVKMVLGGTTKMIADELSTSDFDAIFVSASQSDSLESLGLIIDAVAAATDDAPPIVVGGAILDIESAETVMAATGATYATRNPEEALHHCGLLLTTQDDSPTKFRA